MKIGDQNQKFKIQFGKPTTKTIKIDSNSMPNSMKKLFTNQLKIN